MHPAVGEHTNWDQTEMVILRYRYTQVCLKDRNTLHSRQAVPMAPMVSIVSSTPKVGGELILASGAVLETILSYGYQTTQTNKTCPHTPSVYTPRIWSEPSRQRMAVLCRQRRGCQTRWNLCRGVGSLHPGTGRLLGLLVQATVEP